VCHHRRVVVDVGDMRPRVDLVRHLVRGALLNKTLGSYSDDYRGNVRRVISGTLDECVRKGTIPRHTLSGIQLAPRIVTAEQYEQQSKGMVSVPDDIVAMLAGGLTVKTDTKHRKAGDFRDIPVPDMVWDMMAELPDGPLCPGPSTPYLPYSTARNRFGRLLENFGISGAHTHSLRHQFASEALDDNPRELANISQVLGHDSIETTLRFYIHPAPTPSSASAR
jgi:Phage integrase family